MKAFLVDAPQQVRLVNVPDVPPPGEGEVVLAFGAMGICGSDILVYKGIHPFVNAPRIVGHEFAGTVAEVGPGVAGLVPGDRVCVEPILSCGHCGPCVRGDYHVCETVKVYGVHVHGVCAERITVPAKHVFKLPPNLSLVEGAAVEPICVGLECARRAETQPEDRILILGAGPIGIACMKVSRALGAEEVFVADPVNERRHTAERLGARKTADPTEPGFADAVARWSGGAGPSLVVECSGSAEAFAQALRVAAYRARVVLLSLHKTPEVAIPSIEIVKKELDLLGSRLYKSRFPVALELLAQGRLALDDYVTHRFNFTETPAAFRSAINPPGDSIKIVVSSDAVQED